MIVAPCAANEQERLAALQHYGVLDTAAEKDFDAITSLLAAICETPIALVSLIDRDRQWFKSRVGLEATETPRDLAFCAHAILQNDILVVPDASRDPRFADNPLVLEDPNIRFYAGAPLLTPDKLALGTLCAIDVKPRQLSPAQLQALSTLSRHVVDLLELRLKLAETQRLNQALEKSGKELERLTAERNQLFANINHEMRTPLNAIQGFTQRLQKRIQKDPVPAYVVEGLGLIQNAATNLRELVDDVLDISKVDAGKMELEVQTFAAAELLNTVIAMVSVKAEERNIRIHLQLDKNVPPTLQGDAKKIAQIMLNLLSNAVKFTPAEKQVFVRCSYDEGRLILVVRDEGVGIPEQDLSRIFLPFAQSSGKSQSDIKGTGLGLAIVKAFVDLMSGSIAVSSTLGIGTEFQIALPLSEIG